MGDSSLPHTHRYALRLLADIATEVHPERWDATGIGTDARQRLLACSRSRRRLSRNLGWLGTGATTEDDWAKWKASLSQSPGAWAILTGDALWRIGLRFGAGCFRREIAGLVLKNDVVAFRREIGEDAHSFALKQAPLLWREGALPISGLPDADGEASSADTTSLTGRVRITAGKALGCWLAELPAGLAERTRLKLPPQSDAETSEPVDWPETQRSNWLGLLNRVFTMSVHSPQGKQTV